MDRNTVLAFALSMIVFTVFLMYQEDRYADMALEAESEAVASAELEAGALEAAGEERVARLAEGAGSPVAPSPGSAPAAPALEPPPVVRNIPISKSILENENVIAEISNDPGMITSWQLKDYVDRAPEGDAPIELVMGGHAALATEVAGVPGARFDGLRFEVVEADGRRVVQRATTTDGVLTRTIELDETGYGFDLDLVFESRRTDPVEASFEILWPAAVSDRPDFRELSLVAYGDEAGVAREFAATIGQPGFLGMGGTDDGIERIEGDAVWAGFDLRYFTGVVIDAEAGGGFDVQFEAIETQVSAQTRAAVPGVAVGSGGRVSKSLRGFIGPKSPSILEMAGPGLEHSISRGYSWIEPLVRLFEIALDKLYSVIPNYGLAIIVLTILVRIVVSPLMVRQMRSAEKMRTVQPRVKALQEKYKDDRQKQSEEMMKLWREEGINPLGGCLPLLFQFPVLIGLFYALQSSIGLRQAPFMLWINDLSQPATLFTLPGIDFPVRILPLIMGASMFVQQKMTPTTGMDPAQAKMMLVMMPAMMLFISYTFPSGLVLYWTVSNLLGIGHQYWIRSKMQPAS